MSWMRSNCAEFAAGMACNKVSGAGGCATFSCEHPAREIPYDRINHRRRDLRITGRSYLTATGTSFFAAQTSATIHPITLHPRKRLSRKIARSSRLLRARAMIDGRKYIMNPKPKNGKKMKCDKIITAPL